MLTTANVSGACARDSSTPVQLNARAAFTSTAALHSHWPSYAETMDDEPDVMNDVALRSVVRCAAVQHIAPYCLTPPTPQFIRPQRVAAAALQHYARNRRQSADAGTPNRQQVCAWCARATSFAFVDLTCFVSGSKSLQLDSTDFDD